MNFDRAMNGMLHRLDGTLRNDKPARQPARQSTLRQELRPALRRHDLQNPMQTEPLPYRFELRSLLSCRAIVADWNDLASRALEPNLFAGPEMMLAAAHHLPSKQPPAALLVYAAHDNSAKLLALIPLESARIPMLPDALRGFLTPYHPVGVPLVDKTAAVAVLRAVFDWMAEREPDKSGHRGFSLGATGMIWEHVPLEGAFARAVAEAANHDKRQMDILSRIERPVLDPQLKAVGEISESNRLNLETLNRRSRRLAKQGKLRFEEVFSGQKLRDAVESFMILEASSWKGIRGLALVQNTRTSCFFRAATRMMSSTGQCRALTLYAGGMPVAAALWLESETRSWAYKIAYDASLAKLSPGSILAAEFSRRQLAKAPGHTTDSCMDEPNPVVAQLWNSTEPYGDLMVATLPGKTPAALVMRTRERLRRQLRNTAKGIYRNVMGYSR